MNVHPWAWFATVAVLLAVIGGDLLLTGRGRRAVGMREAGWWTAGAVASGAAFGLVLTAAAGRRYGGEFFAGWITEYSLSVDNLVVFAVIMAKFAVPRVRQPRTLTLGVLVALVLRGGFIAGGAAVTSRFEAAYYVFGAFLVYTAVKLAREDDDAEPAEGSLMRGLVRRLPPQLVVMAAIGVTDLLFALDSIPAIFGLTKEPYIVFSASAFALLGLRQLYFLMDGLLDRLRYLSAGLSVVLAFIGTKMIIEALAGSGMTEVAGLRLPHIGVATSLGVVLGTLAVTVGVSLLRTREWEAA